MRATTRTTATTGPGTLPGVTARPDFGRRAAEYDRVRPADDNWREIYALVVEEADLRGRRVLDCGCGTGRLAAALARDAGARVWGLDAEPRMLEVARGSVPPQVGLRQGRAEALPFRDAWFERAVMWLTCHLVERPDAFGELRRVLAPAGRLAVVTFDESHFDRLWLAPFFPSIERIDRARFPRREQLGKELLAAGFADVHLLRRSQQSVLPRAEALERIERGHISTFDLLDTDELAEGRSRARADLPDAVTVRLEWLVAVASR